MDTFITNLVDELESNKPSPTEYEPEDSNDSGETIFSSSDDKTEPKPETKSSEDVFDPEIHCVNEDGTPKLTKSGKYRRKPGRKNSGSNSGSTSNNSGSTTKARELTNKEAGKVATMMVVTPTVMLLGEEISPNQTEFNSMASAWEAYFEEQGIENVPAWVLVFTTTAAWVAPKLVTKPEPRSKAKSFLQNCWLNIKYLTGKAKNALSNRRNDRKRENNTSENGMPPTNSPRENLFGT